MENQPDEACCSLKMEQRDQVCKAKEVVIEVEKDLSDLPPWPETCISRVPHRLREQNDAAYTPQIISIGPLHHGASKLQFMEAHKLRYLQQFLTRANKRSDEEKDKLLDLIKNEQKNIQRCYEETFDDWCPDNFAKMVLLDSAFIIEMLFMANQASKPSHGDDFKDDFIMGNPWLTIAVKQDLILLENQLPYFIIKKIHGNTFATFCQEDFNPKNMLGCFVDVRKSPEIFTRSYCSCDCCFKIFYCYCCHCCLPQLNTGDGDPNLTGLNTGDWDPNLTGEANHFTDFVRQNLSQGHPRRISGGENGHPPKRKKQGYNYRISATKLQKAGVKFRASGEEAHPLSTSFENGVLSMPFLEVDDVTECLYRNMMAYEQRHCPKEAYICDYIMFMNSLIDSEEDVELLVEKHVMYNGLGDNNSAAQLMNSLDKEIVEIDEYFCFNEICEALEQHYQNPWYNFVAQMRRIYFTDCWRTTGTIAGLVLLLLTLLTSINSIFEIFS